jgi:hypothetical protein
MEKSGMTRKISRTWMTGVHIAIDDFLLLIADC